MTLDDLIDRLRDCDVDLFIEADSLVYHGPRLADDDPLRVAIIQHRAALLDLFRPPSSYDPYRQAPPRPWPCLIAGCNEVIPTDDLAFCVRHRAQADDGTLWERHLSQQPLDSPTPGSLHSITDQPMSRSD